MTLPEPEKDHGHPSQDTSRRFPDDAYLRRHGFKIHSRRKNAEPIWERGGELFRQSEAMITARHGVLGEIGA